jgi:hypothetical protein
MLYNILSGPTNKLPLFWNVLMDPSQYEIGWEKQGFIGSLVPTFGGCNQINSFCRVAVAYQIFPF